MQRTFHNNVTASSIYLAHEIFYREADVGFLVPWARLIDSAPP